MVICSVRVIGLERNNHCSSWFFFQCQHLIEAPENFNEANRASPSATCSAIPARDSQNTRDVFE